MKRSVICILAFTAALLLAAGALGEAGASPAWVPGELIVKFKPGVPAAQKSSLVRGHRVRSFRSSGAEHWKLDDRDAVEAAVAALAADPRVEYAEPNYLLTKLESPNDPLFSQMWGLHNTGQLIGLVTGVPDADIDAVEAWDTFTGSSSVIVAIIDTGIDYTHPDLAANIWTNPGEVAGNGLDDDGNGFSDDIHGWDFANDDADPMDDSSHGTHCAGTIGAIANNGIGVAGVNWNVRLMALKFQGAGGTGAVSDAISCIEYATAMGVDVMSNSWGNNASSTALEEAIAAAYAADIFFVAGAGNNGTDNDDVPFYPSCYDVGNVISVMATDNRDQPAVASDWSSNYGATTVDIAAPGMRIWSTIRNNNYMYLSGTSMSAPHVAGALAMLRGRFPDITVDEGRHLLLDVGSDRLASLEGLCVTGARLNLRKLIADPDTIPPTSVTDLAVASVASNWLTLAWTTPGDDGALERYDLRYAAVPITGQADWEAATEVAGEPVPATAGAPVAMRIDGLEAATTTYFSVRARDEYGNLGALSNSPAGTTLSPPTITVAPHVLSATVAPDGAATRTLTITNSGAGVLDFTIPNQSPAKSIGSPDRAVEAAGGLDAFGYDWSDSDTPGGPAFDWIDIADVGTAVTLTDGDLNQGPFDLGFTFPYYGHDFDSFYISSDGCVSLTSYWTGPTSLALPSVNAAGNLLALLWDQMLTSAGTCHYHSDGNRLIVQYTGVDNVGVGGPFTMQMHLYASGIIEYHYLTMAGSASGSATIGIQNGDGTDGLTVAFDAGYAHDNLAIRFTPPMSWLSVRPDSGSLAAGASLDVEVDFDGAGLCGSRFDGNLHVLSNDPLSPRAVVPAVINLTGVPDIAVVPASLSFGPVRLLEATTRSLAVVNNGCGDLTVAGLDFDNASFSSAQALPLVIAAGATGSLSVVFAPLLTGSISGHLTLVSDDPDSPALGVPLGGLGLDVPDIAVDPGPLAATLSTGGTATRQLTITNNGVADLEFTVADPEYFDQAAKDAGGPDAFGYRWTDSDDPLGPDFDWVEIMTFGTMIRFKGDNENLGPYGIGFSFPFYGNEFTTFRVCTNGWISFTNTSTVQNAVMLPSPVAPENMIAPFWEDLTFEVYGDAFYHFDGRRLIVEYQSVPRKDAPGGCWFQIQLFPSGRIDFLYKAMPDGYASATIGIQNATRTAGLTAAYNTDYVHNILAVRFEANPPWISATPATGTLAAGESAEVAVDFDATGLCDGAYLANLHVRSNDPDNPEVTVPVALTAQSAADARLSASSLAFGDVDLAQNAVRTGSVVNVGCAPLQVTGLSIDNPVFTATLGAPVNLAAGARQAFNVTFTPVTVGPATGTLTLTTSDPRRPILAVPLSGTGIGRPVIVATPGAIEQTVQPNSQRTVMVHLENPGAGPLVWSVTSPDLYDKDAATAGRADGADEPDVTPLGTGGPDSWGYRWIDSNAVGGPAFSWIDIAGTGTAALEAGDDVISGVIPLGFTFNFYGQSYTGLRVCSNGFASFTSTSTTGANRSIPSYVAPYSLIAPFWDNLTLDMAGAGDVWYKSVGGNFVVQWDHVMRAYVSTPVTFEMILTPSGTITFQYLSFGTALLSSATVGIQNSIGAGGLQVVCNAPFLHENMAIRFWIMPRWVTVSPWSGTIPVGGNADVAITFDATDMPLGLHHGHLRILSNDITNPSVPVSLVMNVKDYVSEVPALPTAFALSQNVPNPFNPSTTIGFALPVRGPVELRVYDVRGAVVRTLVVGELEPGYHDTLWDGRSDAGGQVPSGVYFYRLRTSAGDHTRSMTLVK